MALLNLNFMKNISIMNQNASLANKIVVLHKAQNNLNKWLSGDEKYSLDKSITRTLQIESTTLPEVVIEINHKSKQLSLSICSEIKTKSSTCITEILKLVNNQTQTPAHITESSDGDSSIKFNFFDNLMREIGKKLDSKLNSIQEEESKQYEI